MNKQTQSSALEASEAAAQTPPNEHGTTITDSFHWDFHDSLGVTVLGTVVFVLLRALLRANERLLQAYQAGYRPE